MINSSFKFRILLFLFVVTFIYPTVGQNTIFKNLLDSTKWQNLFPRRAGIQDDHNQGYTHDFYSFNNFKQALDEMSDYLVTIRTKNNNGIWISIKRKSTNVAYDYFGNESSWNAAYGESFEMEVDFHPNDIKALVKVVNLLGQEVNIDEQFTGEVLLFLYNDGTVEKKMVR